MVTGKHHAGKFSPAGGLHLVAEHSVPTGNLPIASRHNVVVDNSADDGVGTAMPISF